MVTYYNSALPPPPHQPPPSTWRSYPLKTHAKRITGVRTYKNYDKEGNEGSKISSNILKKRRKVTATADMKATHNRNELRGVPVRTRSDLCINEFVLRKQLSNYIHITYHFYNNLPQNVWDLIV